MRTDVALSRRLLLAGSLAAALTGALSACNSSVSAEHTAEQIRARAVRLSPSPWPTSTARRSSRPSHNGWSSSASPSRTSCSPSASYRWRRRSGTATNRMRSGPGRPRARRGEARGDQGPRPAPLEEIAALTPDLIIGTNAGLTKDVYASLTKIAPTIANSGEYDNDWFEPWPDPDGDGRQGSRQGGRGPTAGRRPDQAVRRHAAGHPQFAEVPAIFLQAPFYEGNAIAYQDGLGTEFLTDLGFVIPEELDAYERGGQQAYIPVENLDVLNAGDVLDLGHRGRRGRRPSWRRTSCSPS